MQSTNTLPRRCAPGAAAVAVCLLAALPAAHAADAPVRMQVPPAIGPGQAAMPLIVGGQDAARRIDAAVGRIDASLRKAAAACRNNDGTPGDWERSVDVPMRGPGFISYVITDNFDCGGLHPSAATMSIVYDLHTGAPVDWTRLLPRSLTGTVQVTARVDGTKMVTLAAKRLYALFLTSYDRDHARPDDAECRDAVRNTGTDGPPDMMAWLDGKQGGLAVQFDLPHAMQACADPAVIPLAALRAEGAQPALLEALEAAGPHP